MANTLTEMNLPSDLRLAAQDISTAFSQRSLWLVLGSWDVRRLYRRSVLGPMWITLSTAIFVGGIGTFYGALLNQPLEQYLPHVACGYVLWLFVSGTLIAGTNVFLTEGEILKQVPVSSFSVVLRMFWRQILIALHNSIVMVVVLAAMRVWPGIQILWFVPGLLLLLGNVLWMALALGLLAARYRDVPPIVASVLQVVFFITPVIWLPDRLPEHFWALSLNPLNAMIELVRAPLLTGQLPLSVMLSSLALLAIGGSLTFVRYAQMRKRLIYWL